MTTAILDRTAEDRQSAAKQPAIDLRALSKRYGKLEAVRGITFEVNPGEMFGLIGPDGQERLQPSRFLQA